MKNKTQLFGAYLPIFAFATLVCVILRTIACLIQFNFETGYFDGGILIKIADGLVIFTVLFMFTYIFTSRRDLKLIPSFTSPATYVPTGIIAIALLFMAFGLFRDALDRYQTIVELSGALSPSLIQTLNSEKVAMVLLFIMSALSVLSAVHFAFTAIVESKDSVGRASFGLCTVLLLSLYTVYLYINKQLPINAPNKIVDQMAILFSAVFFLYETRLSIGREKWREYISFGFISALLCAYSSIPGAIVYFVKSDFALGNEVILSDSIYEVALIFAAFIFITCRILLTGELIEDKENPFVTSMIMAAGRREELLTPTPAVIDEEEQSEELPEEADDNQIEMEIEIPPQIQDASDDGEEDAQNPNE